MHFNNVLPTNQNDKLINILTATKKTKKKQAALKAVVVPSWRVCVYVWEREFVCLFPNESLIVIPAPWNFDQWEDSLLARDNFGPFRNFAVWKQTAPRIKSNIVIILIPVSE